MKLLLYIILSILFPITLSAQSKTSQFTADEEQQISISTPKLFARSNSFQIDFTHLKPTDYSFPLPVGTVTGSTSQALEISTTKGDAVKAMFSGTVRLSRHTATNGNVIVIRHDNGLETLYSQNVQNLVKVGDRVKAGQTIAIVGGLNNKTYCVFSIMVDGRKINPATILNAKSHHLRRQIVTFTKSKDGSIDITTKGKGNKEESYTADNNKETDSRKPAGKEKEKSNSDELKNFDPSTFDVFSESPVYRLDLSTIKNWRYPLDDSHVISGYGGKRRHTGIDIKNAPNKEVYAAFDGVVIQSGVFSAYGKCITIAHPNGLQTRYSHNSKNYVVVGDRVKAGDVIGLTGRTGRATTEHLHFETRINGRPFDPSYVFDHANRTLHKSTLQFKKNGSVARLP